MEYLEPPKAEPMEPVITPYPPTHRLRFPPPTPYCCLYIYPDPMFHSLVTVKMGSCTQKKL